MNGPNLNSYSNVYYMNNLKIPFFLLPRDIKNNEKFIKYINDMRFVNNLNRFTNMRVSSFEWIGLPETIDPVILEMLFMLYGSVGFKRNEDETYIALGLYPYGEDGVSINGRPYNGTMFGFNGESIKCKLYQQGISEPIIRRTATHKLINENYDTVWGQENYTGYSMFNQLLTRVWDLTLRQKILNQNIQGAAQPILITCQESEKESIKKELNKIDEGQYRIIAFNGAFNGDKYEVIDTGFKPEVIQILAQEIQRCEDDIRTILGINSNGAMANKRERLLVDEVNSNNSLINTEIEQSLVFRKRFCEQIKEAFGLDIDCKFRYATPEIENYAPDSEEDTDLKEATSVDNKNEEVKGVK